MPERRSGLAKTRAWLWPFAVCGAVVVAMDHLVVKTDYLVMDLTKLVGDLTHLAHTVDMLRHALF
jgi:hypothetical protein